VLAFHGSAAADVVLTLFLIVALFLPWPWNLVVALCGGVAEIGEITWGLRLAKRRRAQTGIEATIGRNALVVQACRPDGLVRVGGELWQATCKEGAASGETVRVTAVRGLTLEVEPTRAEQEQPLRDATPAR
jgi:membrane-bound serine protease (ClpP class)